MSARENDTNETGSSVKLAKATASEGDHPGWPKPLEKLGDIHRSDDDVLVWFNEKHYRIPADEFSLSLEWLSLPSRSTGQALLRAVQQKDLPTPTPKLFSKDDLCFWLVFLTFPVLSLLTIALLCHR